jgi:hypothetical protein
VIFSGPLGPKQGREGILYPEKYDASSNPCTLMYSIMLTYIHMNVDIGWAKVQLLRYVVTSNVFVTFLIAVTVAEPLQLE